MHAIELIFMFLWAAVGDRNDGSYQVTETSKSAIRGLNFRLYNSWTDDTTTGSTVHWTAKLEYLWYFEKKKNLQAAAFKTERILGW